MISRVVHCHVKPEKIQEFRNTLNQKFVPRITRQSGFVDLLESMDTKTGNFVCNTLWDTTADVERYNQGLFQEIAQALQPLLTEPPTVETMQVENSTAHNINAGTRTAAA
jgi:quinol monooxygenase YgiN